MNYTPKSEEECRPLIAEGEYACEILEATEKQSKKGNDMIELKVKLYKGERCVGMLHDYLLDAMAHKLRHCAYGLGLGLQYEDGSLSASKFEGRSGTCVVGIKKSTDPKYRDQNQIDDYVVGSVTNPVRQAAPVNHTTDPAMQPPNDDSMPF